MGARASSLALCTVGLLAELWSATGCSVLVNFDDLQFRDGSGGGTSQSASGTGGTACAALDAGLYVFVSADKISPGTDFTSVGDANDRCVGWASAAGFGGSWRAWLSETGLAASVNVSGDGPWLRCDGALVAASSDDFVGMLRAGIQVDEWGAFVGNDEPVWTGTTASASVGQTCNDWDPSATGDLGTVGALLAVDANWTEDLTVTCDGSYRLYCFQVGF